MAHGLTSQLLQSSYFRVHLWLLWPEITIQSSDVQLCLKIAKKELNEEKKDLL